MSTTTTRTTGRRTSRGRYGTIRHALGCSCTTVPIHPRWHRPMHVLCIGWHPLADRIRTLLLAIAIRAWGVILLTIDHTTQLVGSGILLKHGRDSRYELCIIL